MQANPAERGLSQLPSGSWRVFISNGSEGRRTSHTFPTREQAVAYRASVLAARKVKVSTSELAEMAEHLESAAIMLRRAIATMNLIS